jgi:hypothetical protein
MDAYFEGTRQGVTFKHVQSDEDVTLYSSYNVIYLIESSSGKRSIYKTRLFNIVDSPNIIIDLNNQYSCCVQGQLNCQNIPRLQLILVVFASK